MFRFDSFESKGKTPLWRCLLWYFDYKQIANNQCGKFARKYEPKFLLFFMRIAVLMVIIISSRVVFLRN